MNDAEPIKSHIGDKPGILLPRYDLSEAELLAREASLIDEVNDRFEGKEDLYAVWVKPQSEYADILRTQESYYWPSMDEIMADHETSSLFLALVDTRNDRNEVVHGFRVTGNLAFGVSGVSKEGDSLDESSTGIVLIDDIVNSNQNFTVEEFREYYDSRGFDVSKFISVETNFNRPGLTNRVERYNGLPATQVGYLSLFQLCDKEGLSVNETAIFASLNDEAITSLGLMGAEYEALAGRNDLMTPIENGEFDPEYKPVAIPATEVNLNIFREIAVFAAPTITI